MVTLMLTPPPPEILVNTVKVYFYIPHSFFPNLLLKFLVTKSLFFTDNIHFN